MGVIVGGKFINPDAFTKRLTTAFAIWANDDINDSYWDDFFKDDRWSYPGETRRKNGGVVSSPRDIYDLGNLYDSGRESFTLNLAGNSPKASWNWNATNESGRAYAWYVHEGLGTNLAPRPWTDAFQVPAKFERGVAMRSLKNRIREAFMK